MMDSFIAVGHVDDSKVDLLISEIQDESLLELQVNPDLSSDKAVLTRKLPDRSTTISTLQADDWSFLNADLAARFCRLKATKDASSAASSVRTKPSNTKCGDGEGGIGNGGGRRATMHSSSSSFSSWAVGGPPVSQPLKVGDIDDDDSIVLLDRRVGGLDEDGIERLTDLTRKLSLLTRETPINENDHQRKRRSHLNSPTTLPPLVVTSSTNHTSSVSTITITGSTATSTTDRTEKTGGGKLNGDDGDGGEGLGLMDDGQEGWEIYQRQPVSAYSGIGPDLQLEGLDDIWAISPIIGERGFFPEDDESNYVIENLISSAAAEVEYDRARRSMRKRSYGRNGDDDDAYTASCDDDSEDYGSSSISGNVDYDGGESDGFIEIEAEREGSWIDDVFRLEEFTKHAGSPAMTLMQGSGMCNGGGFNKEEKCRKQERSEEEKSGSEREGRLSSSGPYEGKEEDFLGEVERRLAALRATSGMGIVENGSGGKRSAPVDLARSRLDCEEDDEDVAGCCRGDDR